MALRLPNPGSDLNMIILIFKTLYSELQTQSNFDLDDITDTMIASYLASSCGYTGKKAQELSTRSDRSRDPLYNQSKSYAEVFRMLGWISSSDPNTALCFEFTYLGDHVYISNENNQNLIFEQCLLNIAYPNNVLTVKHTTDIRPFATMLRYMKAMGNQGTRDEFIIGPLYIDDTNIDNFNNLILHMKKIRGNKKLLDKTLSNYLKTEGIAITTARNYTRLISPSFIYCGWATSEIDSSLYPGSRNLRVLKLTHKGLSIASKLDSHLDIRLKDFNKNSDIGDELIRVAMFNMLDDCGYDVASIQSALTHDKELVFSRFNTTNILFSPYQILDKPTVDNALSYFLPIKQSTITTESREAAYNDLYLNDEVITNKLSLKPSSNDLKVDTELTYILKELYDNNNTIEEIVNTVANKYSKSNQNSFYPLITEIFNILGFNCTTTRPGVNPERWDAIIKDDKYSIAIEIKSPAEENHISSKAIRQALENKIVLLSRETYSTDFDSVSLAIGYKLPNDRSEVSRMIKDIKLAYGIRIGVIDIYTLLKLTVLKLCFNKSINLNDLRLMEGIINV